MIPASYLALHKKYYKPATPQKIIKPKFELIRICFWIKFKTLLHDIKIPFGAILMAPLTGQY